MHQNKRSSTKVLELLVHSLLHDVRNLQTYQERKATSAAELQNKIQSEYRLKTQKKTTKVCRRLLQSADSTERLQKTPKKLGKLQSSITSDGLD